ncbi:MAG TPA: hypothetical protein VMM59_11555, partial [Thermohalobaculum sp.]|nr:hypothetical protein [Thermohalobaculum sp.]
GRSAGARRVASAAASTRLNSSSHRRQGETGLAVPRIHGTAGGTAGGMAGFIGHAHHTSISRVAITCLPAPST